MTDHGHEQTQAHSILVAIHKGMTVFDNQNQEIGEVDEIHFGASTATQRAHGTGPVTATAADVPYEDPIMGIVADIFNPSEVPKELAEKLMRTGYIRLDSAGLFAADRYIMPNQIASVASDGVRLKVARHDLLKRN